MLVFRQVLAQKLCCIKLTRVERLLMRARQDPQQPFSTVSLRNASQHEPKPGAEIANNGYHDASLSATNSVPLVMMQL